MIHMLSFQLEISKENMYIVHPKIPTPNLCWLIYGQSQVDSGTSIFLVRLPWCFKPLKLYHIRPSFHLFVVYLIRGSHTVCCKSLTMIKEVTRSRVIRRSDNAVARGKRTKDDLQNTIQKTKHWATRTPLPQ